MHSKHEHVMRGVGTFDKWTCWPMLGILALKKLRKEDQPGLRTQ